VERSALNKLIEVECKEQCYGDLDAEIDINSAWEGVRETITISAKGSL
jgi:hypothetical protein